MKIHQNPIHAFLLVSLLLTLIFAAGCTRRIGCTNLANVYFLGTVTDLNQFAYKIADTLVRQANPMLLQRSPKHPVLVTTFVDDNNLAKTNAFGRILQKSISDRFVQHSFSVREILLGDTIFIEPGHGETVLTRDLSRLATRQNTQAVIVGTWTRTGRTLYLSIRAVNPENGIVLSSQGYRLCMDDDILELFNYKAREGKNDIVSPHQPWLNHILPIFNF